MFSNKHAARSKNIFKAEHSTTKSDILFCAGYTRLHGAISTLRKKESKQVSEQDGWTYFTRHPRGETKYRIYLSPDIVCVGDIFADIAASIPADVGYQMKTFGGYPGWAELARNDKIIVYCSEKSVDQIFEAIRAVHTRHQQAFFHRLTPPGGLPTEMTGISVTLQPDAKGGEEVTGTQEKAHSIDERILENANAIVTRRFRAFGRNPAEVSAHDEGIMLCSVMMKLAEKNKWHTEKKWPKDNEGFSEDIQAKINQAFAHAVYSLTAYGLATDTPLSLQKCHEAFVKNLSSIGLPQRQLQTFASSLSTADMLMYGYNIPRLVKESIRFVGAALPMCDALKQGRSPGEAFRSILVQP